MFTPVNREMIKMTDLNMKTCRQTLINWLWKGGEMLGKLIPALKDIALDENADTNCNETWCRVKAVFCCWAHARQYFKLAQEQGNDHRVKVFLSLIGQLCGLESQYKSEGLTPAQIYERRNYPETNEIISSLCINLHDMLNIKESLSQMMQKAVNLYAEFLETTDGIQKRRQLQYR